MMRLVLCLVALVDARAEKPKKLPFGITKEQMDQTVDMVPEDEREQMKEMVEKDERDGFDIPPQYEAAIQKYFTPDLELSHIVGGVDPACLPQKCPEAFDACRRFDKGCEKRVECMQDTAPSKCFGTLKLGKMSSAEGGLLMCGEKQKCMELQLSGFGGLGLSFIQLDDGSYSVKAKNAADIPKAAMKAQMDMIDASFMELDSQLKDLNDGDDDEEGYDLQKELSSIATSAKVDDFDAALSHMEDTQAKMAKSNQELESLRMKMQGEQEKLEKKKAAGPTPEEVEALPALKTATSFLETPALEELHEQLGNFLKSVTQNVADTEKKAQQEGKHMKKELAAAEDELSGILAPETREALRRAGVPTSFVEDSAAIDAFHAAKGKAEAKGQAEAEDTSGAKAVDAHGNISPEALMAISQLKDFKMPKTEQWANIMKGFQEASGKPNPENITDLVSSMGSFLQDAQAHGGFTNVVMHALTDDMSKEIQEKGKDLKPGPEMQALVEKIAKQANFADQAKGAPYGKTDTNTLMASMAAMSGVGLGGINQEELVDSVVKGPLGKYFGEAGLTMDSPLVEAAAAFVQDNKEERKDSKGKDQSGEAKAKAKADAAAEKMSELMPQPETLMKMALGIMKDPAAMAAMQKIGFSLPGLGKDQIDAVEQGMAKLAKDQAGKPNEMRQEKKAKK